MSPGFIILRSSFLVPARDGAFDCYVEASLLIQSNVCDAENAPYVSGALTSYLALLADSPLHADSGHKPKRLFSAFKRELLAKPIAQTVNNFSRLFDSVYSNSYTLDSGDSIIHFEERMKKTPVFKEYLTYYKTGDPLCLSYVLTFLSFLKKAEYHEDDFNTVAFRDWLEVEERLKQLELPDVTALKAIMSAILPDPNPHNWYPKFGPGAVAEPGIRGVVLKASNLGYHPRLARAFASQIMGVTYAIGSVLADGDNWSSRPLSSDISELRFVPKDMRKSRSMCMEPNSFMYFQQLVKNQLYEAITAGPLRGRIPLYDQGVNRRLAIYGSETNRVDTIDLSAASDSVHVDLVRAIFPRKWLYYLLATRTHKVRVPDGTVVEVLKFAPMGSALCFPVQSLIFTTVVIYNMMTKAGWIRSMADKVNQGSVKKFLRYHVASGPLSNEDSRSDFEAFSVFGDDIICDSKVTDDVTDVLTSLGFVVNTSKSFIGLQASRESCGVFANRGNDVTPWRYKVGWYSNRLAPSVVAGLIDCINNAGEHSYYHARRFLLHLLLYSELDGVPHRDGVKNPILFTELSSDELGIKSRDPVNTHLRSRWNKDYQRSEWRSYAVRIKSKNFGAPEQREYVEFYGYIQDQGARYRAVTNEPKEVSFARYRPEETGVSWRWTPNWNVGA